MQQEICKIVLIIPIITLYEKGQQRGSHIIYIDDMSYQIIKGQEFQGAITNNSNLGLV